MLRATRPRPVHEASPTVPDVIAAALASDPAALLVVDGAARWSRAETAARAAVLARALTAAGVAVGDVVVVQLPNRAWTVAALHAVWAIGAIPCPVTPIYRAAELGPILDAARPAAVLVPDAHGEVAYAANAEGALRACGHTAPVLRVDLDAAAIAPAPVVWSAAARADDVAMLMFTSGTTGRPKGVLHTHRTLLTESRSLIDVLALTPEPVFMPSPLAHVTGLLYGIVLPALLDTFVVLQDRWDADAAVDAIEAAGCRFTVAATPFLRGLTDAYAARGIHSSLRTFVCGGADIPAALVADARTHMGATVCRTYGSTEMPTLCIVRPGDAAGIATTTEGRVIGDARARLSDVDGDVGDLEVQGPELFVGYLDAGDNAAAFTDDGWFRTGDLARIRPGGEVAIAGRRKDLIVRGGENISAKEIEDLLLSHPDVDDVAVVGLPDDVMGERACAVVVTTRDDLTIADLAAHLIPTGIARQKFPEALYRTTALTRTVSGKVQKFQLRAQVLAAADRGEVELRRR